jgi:hypothetical protein
MKIVIDISDDTYKAVCNGCMLPPDVENVVNAIINGTSLPEHHGRLVDADKLIRECLAFNDEDATKIIKALEQQTCEDVGELSDGYHTFNQLYHQRAVLFACIVRQNKNKAWKSFKHSDGKYCFDSNGEWFIVGVDTPQGSYTYHYAKEYWDIFDCQELECGKEWDGHTEEDVTRLLSLPYIESEDENET